MSFISKTDLQKAIKADMLSTLLQADDTVVTSAADSAEAKMKEYMANAFDVDTIFAKTGTNRHKLVVDYCVDIAIYFIWKYIDPMGIPAMRKNAYDEAMEWLKAAMKGEVSSTLPAATEPDESGGTLYFSSNDARENSY